jgi:hypothetical protein
VNQLDPSRRQGLGGNVVEMGLQHRSELPRDRGISLGHRMLLRSKSNEAGRARFRTLPTFLGDEGAERRRQRPRFAGRDASCMSLRLSQSPQ